MPLVAMHVRIGDSVFVKPSPALPSPLPGRSARRVDWYANTEAS